VVIILKHIVAESKAKRVTTASQGSTSITDVCLLSLISSLINFTNSHCSLQC